MSRKTLYGAVIGCVVFVTVVFLWSGLQLLSRPDAPSPATPASAAYDLRPEGATRSADARVLGDTLLRQWGTQLDVPNQPTRP